MQISRTRWAALSTVVVAVSLASAQEQTETNKPAASAKVGQPAPDFTLVDTVGKKYTLSDMKDRVVVLQWVNQECPWSQKAVPAFKDIQRKYEGKGIVWLGIDSTNGRTADEVTAYVKEKEISNPVLLDSDGKVGRMYGAKTTPHVFVISKGTLVYAGALHNNQQGDKKPAEVRNYVDDAVGAVLVGREVPLAETTPWGCNVKYAHAGKRGGHAGKGAAETKEN